MTLEKRLPVAVRNRRRLGRRGGGAAALAGSGGRRGGVELAAVAAPLGADVPVCLAGRPCGWGAWAKCSRRRRISAIRDAAGQPGRALATAAVFRARGGAFPMPADLPAGWDDAAAMARDAARRSKRAGGGGDRRSARRSRAALAALAALPGCLLARMSGSGATCFGLFATVAEAAAAAASVQRRAPGWWTWGGAGSGD